MHLNKQRVKAKTNSIKIYYKYIESSQGVIKGYMPSSSTIFIILLTVGSTVFLANRLLEFGVFSKTEDFNVEGCEVIANIAGPEDIQVSKMEDILFISSYNWEAFFKGKPEQGGIYVLDIKQKDAKPKLVSLDAPAEFKPHGLSIYTNPETSEKVLFVTNYKFPPTVEIFDIIDRETIKHRETITAPHLVSLNEVLGVGMRSFYVTQDSKYALGLFKLFFATLFGYEGGSVNYFDGKDWKVVADDIHFANGLALSQDQKTLYLGETNKMRIRAYERNLETGDLILKSYIPLGAGPDNINVDSNGDLWVVGFPNMLAIMNHLQDKTAKSPVKVVKITLDGDKPKEIQTMLTSSGEVISGISATDFYNDKFIISGIMHTEVRMCSLPQEGQTETKENVDL